MVQLNFDASKVNPAGSYTVFDSGVYDVMISGSEMKETKAKAAGSAQRGAMLVMTMKIASGPHAGGTLIDRVNIENDNSVAEEIGQAQLSAICRVVNVIQLQDTQQLHGIPFKIEVAKVERNDKPGQFSNEVKGYQNAAGQSPDQIGQPGAATQQPPVQQPVTQPAVAAAPVAQPAAVATQPPAQPAAQQQLPVETATQPAQQAVEQQPAAQPATTAPPWAQQPAG